MVVDVNAGYSLRQPVRRPTFEPCQGPSQGIDTLTVTPEHDRIDT